MRWAKTSLRNSFFGWFGRDPVVEPTQHLERVRAAMLQALDQLHGATNATLERRLLFARHIDELWYARPDLMNAIAEREGESAARDRLAEITTLFQGNLPRQLRPGRSGESAD